MTTNRILMLAILFLSYMIVFQQYEIRHLRRDVNHEIEESAHHYEIETQTSNGVTTLANIVEHLMDCNTRYRCDSDAASDEGCSLISPVPTNGMVCGSDITLGKRK